MNAAWYEQQGPPDKVLIVGIMDTVEPGPGEVRIRVAVSGINPGDVKKLDDTFGIGMPFPRIIPHSDGAGVIDQVGLGVPSSRIGERVWCYGAQSYRPFGTAAEYVVVPETQAITLAGNISFEQGACLGIPGITAHRAVHIGGSVHSRTVLVQGGAGAVGQCAVALARHAGAHVIATVRSSSEETIALHAGAHHAVSTQTLSPEETLKQIQAISPQGIDHIVEVAFDANIFGDEALLHNGGSIAAYATGNATPNIPFWPLVFKNIRLYFLGSDDFPAAAKTEAAQALNSALASGWPGFAIAARYPLHAIAEAHQAVAQHTAAGRVVLTVSP